MGKQEHEQLIEQLIERLRVEGAPEGTWLVDLTAARRDLRRAGRRLRNLLEEIDDAGCECSKVGRDVDLLLERLQQALLRERDRSQPQPPG